MCRDARGVVLLCVVVVVAVFVGGVGFEVGGMDVMMRGSVSLAGWYIAVQVM